MSNINESPRIGEVR